MNGLELARVSQFFRMNAMDSASAEVIQETRQKLQKGPWNTGLVGGRGYIVTETLNGTNEGKGDGITRYTDRYLQRRTIGRSSEDFPFDSRFLPAELYKAAGLKPAEKPQDPSSSMSRVDRLALFDVVEPIKKEEEEEEEQEEEDAEDLEDEFEEAEDDDYNAEKYFDDGDEEGEADDGDQEAAY